MSTIQDFTQPSQPEAPPSEEPAPSEPEKLSQRGRPTKVVQRDLAIARCLAEEERSLHHVMAALELPWRVTYNSVCRLREQGLVELNRNGTRTPTWRVTEQGHTWLGTTAPTSEPAPPPPPEPTPIAPPVPPDSTPAPVAEVPQAAEPVWPV